MVLLPAPLEPMIKFVFAACKSTSLKTFPVERKFFHRIFLKIIILNHRVGSKGHLE